MGRNSSLFDTQKQSLIDEGVQDLKELRVLALRGEGIRGNLILRRMPRRPETSIGRFRSVCAKSIVDCCTCSVNYIWRLER